MAYYERIQVDPDFQGVTRKDRQGGSYLRYHPDALPTGPVAQSPELSELITDASTRVAALGERLRARPMPLLYATLLRSESIASSWLEGLHESPRNVMVARLEEVEGTRGTARGVLRNIEAMEESVTALVKPAWTHADVHAVHRELMPTAHEGRYRQGQEYIGGTSPLTAQYVAPPHTDVDALMDDLLRYVNAAGDPPLVAAALAHAQFETIHPYEDGNGRTGRVLFHGVLARAGLVDQGVLPLSLVLRDDDGRGYVAALTAFRPGSDDPTVKAAAREAFLTYFLDAVIEAAAIADAAIADVDQILTRWRPYVERLRTDSSVHRLLDLLTQQPVLTPGYVQERLAVTRATADRALGELVQVGIVQKSGGRLRRQSVYQAGEVLALMDRHVPGPQSVFVPPLPPTVPARRYGGARCGQLLSRKKVACSLPLGHPGSHRALTWRLAPSETGR